MASVVDRTANKPKGADRLVWAGEVDFVSAAETIAIDAALVTRPPTSSGTVV